MYLLINNFFETVLISISMYYYEPLPLHLYYLLHWLLWWIRPVWQGLFLPAQAFPMLTASWMGLLRLLSRPLLHLLDPYQRFLLDLLNLLFHFQPFPSLLQLVLRSLLPEYLLMAILPVHHHPQHYFLPILHQIILLHILWPVLF